MPNFWQRTLEIFKGTPVKLQLRDGTEVIGEIVIVNDNSCTFKKPDGTTTIYGFGDLRACEPAVGRL